MSQGIDPRDIIAQSGFDVSTTTSSVYKSQSATPTVDGAAQFIDLVTGKPKSPASQFSRSASRSVGEEGDYVTASLWSPLRQM